MIMKILFVLIFKGEMREKNRNENDFFLLPLPYHYGHTTTNYTDVDYIFFNKKISSLFKAIPLPPYLLL
jgi:hypothetical protein